MDTKKRSTIWAVCMVLIFSGALSFAMEGGLKIPLMGMKKHPGAMGTAMIHDHNISIEASGLENNAVYTAWFVNMKPEKHETGAGMPPYMFKTDNEGKAIYTSAMKESPIGKWQMVMIVLHPTGDPKDMKNMVGALKGSL